MVTLLLEWRVVWTVVSLRKDLQPPTSMPRSSSDGSFVDILVDDKRSKWRAPRLDAWIRVGCLDTTVLWILKQKYATLKWREVDYGLQYNTVFCNITVREASTEFFLNHSSRSWVVGMLSILPCHLITYKTKKYRIRALECNLTSRAIIMALGVCEVE